jgi:PKD repeat protein
MRKIYLTSLLLCLFGGLFAQVQILAPHPVQTTTFTGNVRGYWFVSPTCFTLTGVEVPTTASSGPQSIAVVRLQANPPLYSTTTNVFTTLFLTQSNAAAGILPVNIQIEQGDIIGVLAQRSTVNSYSAASNTTIINGQNVTLNRLGMQFPLTTTPPQQLWTEASGSISRCFMYYDSLLHFAVTSTPTGPLSVDFSDASDSSFTSVWNYGDGSPLDSTWNPSHTFSTYGTYVVCSDVITSCSTYTVCDTITLCPPAPVSNFNYVDSSLVVTFMDSSIDANVWFWDFGDGSTDTVANPTHTYANVGWYNVCLMTTNICGLMDTLCDSVLICASPSASFSATLAGGDTLSVSATGLFGQSYWWDFGDGTTDTLPISSHIYTTDGTYNVCLIVSNICGADTSCQSVTVCATPLNSDWTYLDNNFDFTFTNLSTGANSYMWTFGDGGTDTTASPTHIYQQNGTYVICLTVTNACGFSSVSCDTVLVDVIGVNNAFPGLKISVSPNPMSQQAFVMVQMPGQFGDYTFELTDLRGAIVHAAKGQFNEKLTISRKQLAAGMYIFRIRQGATFLGSGRLRME